MMPPQGSAFAVEVDSLYMFLFWLSVFLFLGIAVPAIYFSWRYRYKPGRVTPHQTHNTLLEILWSAGPLILCVGIFFWGLNGWMKYSVAPGESMEIQVTAKKWQWAFEYPDGTRTLNEIHVLANKPVRFVMTSEDVLHDFFVPDMRVKHDIVPGRYTGIWFTPTVMGEHHVTCAEYCGKGHSDMQAKLFVDTQDQFDKFMLTGGTEWEDYKGKPADWGKVQYERKGCQTCHSIDGSKTAQGGPSWKGIWGEMVTMNDGQQVLVDAAYVRESMMQPAAKIVKGYEPIMPTFQGLLRETEIQGLIAYIKSLGNDPNGGPAAPTTLTLPPPPPKPGETPAATPVATPGQPPVAGKQTPATKAPAKQAPK
jgi:cytochrome c oxidase subunit II